MDNEILLSCMRATSKEPEFSIKSKRLKESNDPMVGDTEKVGAQKIGVTPTDVGPDPTTTITKISDNVKLEAEGDADEFEDEMYDVVVDDDSTPVIDTDLDSDDTDIDKEDYVGKYVVVCPLCMNPLFSEKPSGEIYCPVCDQEVEIEEPVAKTIVPGEVEDEEVKVKDKDGDVEVEDEFNDEFDTESLKESNDPMVGNIEKPQQVKVGDVGQAVVEECLEVLPESDPKSVKMVADPTNTVTTVDPKATIDSVAKKAIQPNESISAETSRKAYSDYTAKDLDPVKTGGEPEKILQAYRDGNMSSKVFSHFIAESKKVMEADYVGGPDWGYALASKMLDKKATKDDENRLVTALYKDKYYDKIVSQYNGKPVDEVDEKILKDVAEESGIARDLFNSKYRESCGECTTQVSVCPEGGVQIDNGSAQISVAPASGDCCVDTDIIQVDEVDTDSLDSTVNQVLPEVFNDEDISYESKRISRNGKGFVVEGVIKSGANSQVVRLVCNECRARHNVFRLEGINKLIGKLIVETSYNPNKKELIAESAGYKLLTKVNGKAVVLSSKRR